MIPLFKPYHSHNIESKVIDILRSGAIAGGSYVEQFSNEFGELIGQDYVTTTSDMTNAIIIALRLAGVGPGDKVLSTPFACMSTNSAITACGAYPVWVDVDPYTATIDLEYLKKVATRDCKVLLLYHVSGYPNPLDEITDFCKKNNIVLIEDCDNALLATYNGVQVGRYGTYSIYSFYPNRHINTLEGGALVCSLPEDAARAKLLRRFGIDFLTFRTSDGEINPDSDIPEIGLSASMSNIAAAIGLEQLSGVHSRIEKHRSNAKQYDRAFSNLNSIKSIIPINGADPSYWTYLIKADNSNDLLAYLKGKGVGCSRLHYLNHRYSGFGVPVPILPGSDELMRSIIAIPCGFWLSTDEVNQIITLIQEFDSI